MKSGEIRTSLHAPGGIPRLQQFIDRHILIILFLPAFIVLFILTIGPFLWAFGMSFTNYNLTEPDALRFVGLQTYKIVLSNPSFWNAVFNTLYLVGSIVVMETILGVLVALLLSRQFWGVQVVRSLVIVPLMTTPIVVALTWRMLYNVRFGWVNYFLGLVGIPKIDWLGNPFMAMPSIIIADIWAATPFMTTLILAGLLSLSDEPFEAAVVDGATPWQIFWRVTLPLIQPVLILTIMFRTVDAFRKFESILILTAGGPGDVTTTINYLAYNTGIYFLRFADASVMVVIMVALMLGISLFLIRLYTRVAE